MPLLLAEIGETRTVSDFRGKEDVKRHLQDIGFIKGEKIKILSENKSGIILLVKGARVALDRGLAAKIIVT